jgi:hypothetical protein
MNLPPTKPTDATSQEEDEANDVGGGAGWGSDGQPPLDPIIRVLLARLPRSGDVWPETQRQLWLDLLAGSFKLIYKEAQADVPTQLLVLE